MATKGNKTLVEKNNPTQGKKNGSIVIVRTEWNAPIVDELEKGCLKILKQKGYKEVQTITVPGAVEIPFGIKSYWEKMKYRDNKPEAFIALGCVIRGGTPHFEYVCKAVTDGVVQLNLILPIPSIFGVLTVDDEKQAKERIGGKHGHKGEEAALTAISMIELLQTYRKL